ncbi:MAG: cardiolipin synthase [Mycoplasmatales bacterium]
MSQYIKMLLFFVISISITWFVVYSPFSKFYILISLIAITQYIIILLSRKNFYQKYMWLVMFIINPIFAMIAYHVLGKDYREFTIYRSKRISDKALSCYELEKSTLDESDKYFRTLEILGKQVIHENTNAELLVNGEQKFAKMLTCLRDAKKYIHLEYYIVHDSKIAEEIFEILIDKAQAGIPVRLLFDDVGSDALSKVSIKRLLDGGVKIGKFGEVKIAKLNDKINFRNHRKIAIIDGIHGFIGGINIGDEYINHDDGSTKKWRDTHIYLEGKALHDLQIVFAKDWLYTTNENFILSNEHLYLQFKPYVGPGDGFVQIMPDGPDCKYTSIREQYFKLIMQAKKSVLITTPYLIPEPDLVTALKVAAKSGVDVRIITPGNPDRQFVYAATRSYYTDLLEAGIRIFEQNDTFVHSKIFIIDEKIASVGTTNFDYRSFSINFEITAFMYKSPIMTDLLQNFEIDQAQCSEVILENWKKRSFFAKLFESFAQLFSPLL